MIDYKNELGPLLTKVLKIIKESAEPISRDELARIMKVSNRIATDYLKALYNRGYIMDKRRRVGLSVLTGLITLTCIITGGRAFGHVQSFAR